jgi:hypothetical protein
MDKKEIKSGEKQKVTISIDSGIYKSFQKYCDERGLMLSKNLELFMKKELGENGK